MQFIIKHFLQIHLLKLNLCFITWCQQQEALVSTWNQIKQSSWVLIKIVSLLKGKSLKLVDQFIYFSSNISSTESNINIHIDKALYAINKLLTLCKSDLFDKIKWKFCSHVSTHHHHHYHHHVAPSARISLTLSRHPSLSSITSGRSSGLHPISAQSCCM